MPHGVGLGYLMPIVFTGISPNELTAVEGCDDFAYTPVA